jgi:hypothetical protein
MSRGVVVTKQENTMTLSSTTSPAQARPRMKTDSAQLLAQWIYVEYSAMRVLCGWGRDAEHWEDKLAMCYGTWLQHRTSTNSVTGCRCSRRPRCTGGRRF